MLKIRLARRGSKDNPHYRIVVANSRAPRDGKFKEILGRYHPLLDKDDPGRVVLNTERLSHWLSVGAQVSTRVEGFMVDAGLREASERPVQTKKNKPKAKALERLKELAEKQEKAKQAESDNAEKSESSESSDVAKSSETMDSQPAE